MAASRFRSKAGLYHFGKLRRADRLPVNGNAALEQTVGSLDSGPEDLEEDEYVRDMESVYDDNAAAEGGDAYDQKVFSHRDS